MTLSVAITKRVMDVVISSTILLVCAVPMLIIGILIKMESKGPAIYCQRRMRMGDKDKDNSFPIYKFRTMSVDAESGCGAVNAVGNDPRVTRIGKFLRPTRLDELPNFFNVLLGDMSIVGPRADRYEIKEQVEKDFPLIWARTSNVKPGITGLAQLHLKSNGTLQDGPINELVSDTDFGKPVNSFRYKLYFDYAYALRLNKFWTFIITDILIMIKTPMVMFIKRNVI